MSFYNVTSENFPVDYMQETYGHSFFSDTSGYISVFHSVNGYGATGYFPRESDDLTGTTWSGGTAFGTATTAYNNGYFIQDGSTGVIYASGCSNGLSNGGYMYARYTSNGDGTWGIEFVSGGGSYYYAYGVTAGLCSNAGYPIMGIHQYDKRYFVAQTVNDAWDTIASSGNNWITATTYPTAKAMVCTGSEMVLILNFDDGSGLKTRYYSTSGYAFPASDSGNRLAGTVMHSSPSSSNIGLQTYQETASSDYYILLRTASNDLVMYKNSFSSPVSITGGTRGVHPSIGSVNGVVACMYLGSDSTGFYYVQETGNNLWSSPVLIDDTSVVGYYYPRIIRNCPSTTLHFVFSDVTITYPNIKTSSFVLPSPVEVSTPVSCGYVGQVATTAPDLSHLPDGQTVAILADGEVLAEQVISGGTIELPDGHSIVHIGLPYYADLETLNVEVSDNEGTAMTKREKINDVTIMMKDSRGGWLGSDENSLWEGFSVDAIRQSSGYNLGDQELFTGDVRQNVGGEYDVNGRFMIRQVDPLPISIGAVIPEVDIGGRSL